MLLFIISIVAVIVGAICIACDAKPVGVVAIVLALVLFFCSFFTTIPAGHTGVVTSFGKVEDTTLDSGLHMVAPWKNVIKMDNREQKSTIEIKCFSSDIQEVSMVYTINYKISSENAMVIYKNIGKGYYDTVVVPTMMEAIKIEAAQYTAADLVNKRSELAEGIENRLYEDLMVYNIIVTNTSIEDMDFTDTFTNAVEEKQVAEQNMLRAETEAAQKVIEAEAAAQVRQIEADAEAYEVTIRASAEAEANQMIAKSLTDELINYTYASTWNGILPTYMADSNTTPVLNFTN